MPLDRLPSIPGSLLSAFLAALLSAGVASAQVRVVNYNVAKLAGSGTAIRAVLVECAADDSRGFAVAPSVLAFQEVRAADLAALDGHVAAAFPGIPFVRATYTTSTTEDGSGGAQCLYYRSDALSEIASGHADIATGASRNSDRWLLQLNGYTPSNATRFYVYSSHLKASNTSADAAERNQGAIALRNNANALGAGVHIVYAGDFNMYTNAEAAYATMTGAGTAQAIDPLGPANWTGVGGAIKHTQSPRDVSGTLVGGGVDDRFDFQFSTGEFHDGDGLSIVPNTYRTLGNDGLHYNIAINTGGNSYFPGQASRSLTLANNLFNASDHLPVIADYQVPPVMQATAPSTFGPVIRGATGITVAVAVSNAASVVHPLGVDALAATVTGSGVLGGSQSITAALTPASTTVSLPVNTSVAGTFNGTATVSTTVEGTQNPTIVRSVSGTVLAPSNPSWSPKSNQTARTVAASFARDSGVQEIQVPLHNRGYTAAMARLDADGASAVSAPFAIVDVVETNIGASPATLRFSFNTNGLVAGDYTQSTTVWTSDENLPGAVARPLTLGFTVTVTGSAIPGDLDGDGFVNATDLAMLLAQWGGSGSGDIDGDGTVGGGDLAALLASWTG
jgi:endonuclease/exonuclease/phosphatase family metal-dependent hydrolase